MIITFEPSASTPLQWVGMYNVTASAGGEVIGFTVVSFVFPRDTNITSHTATVNGLEASTEYGVRRGMATGLVPWS